MNKAILSIWIFLCAFAHLHGQGTQLLRQPTISSESIVFVYANDLWKVDRAGGDAIRLTSNEGGETLPHFSPDEQYIAFTGQYDGNTDVYVIPATGGSPKRLTYHPGGDYVQGWTPDGKVVFRSSRYGHPTVTNKLFAIGLDGGFPMPIDAPRAAFGEVSPTGDKIAYTPITFWDPEWRNYRGGQAMPVWIQDLTTHELIRTPQLDQERHLDPIWFGKEVFYLSERDYTSNIWAFNPTTKKERQVTTFKKFDVKSHDACKDAIVYEQGGYLHLLNPTTGESKQLTINVKGDMNFARVRWEDVRGHQLSNAQISPNGKRAIFEHRGEIFTVPKEEGDWRNLTKTPAVADRAPVWSPKGDRVAWFSDADGEYKLMVADQTGLNPKTIDLPNPTFYFKPDWSADGEHIAYTDTDYNIWICNVETGVTKKIDTDRYAHPNRAMNPIWSPDGKWLAYAKQLESHFKAIFLYHLESNKSIQLTDGMADATTPVWDKSGESLYFLASTNYGLNSGWLDMSSYDPDVSRRLYMVLLEADESSPFLWKSDEETVKSEEEEETDEEENDSDDDKEEEDLIEIEEEGLQQRIIAVPNVSARNYIGLEPGPEGTVFYLEVKPNSSGVTVNKYSIEDQEGSVFLEGINYGKVSFDRKSMLYRKGSSWFIVGTGGKPKGGAGKLNTSIRLKVDPQAEYQQIFKEGWRFMRDFLYVDNVHGAPWDDIYEWYSPWVKHVRHRSDMNYVVDILSGEVAVGHSYVSGGDFPDLERVSTGLLGADFEIADGHYRIRKIYSGESWNPDLEAPLAIPGLEVEAGDYLLAVNGQTLRAEDNIYSFFEETTDRQTTLSFGKTTSMENAKEVVVKPISSESQLRTFDWIESNRQKVDELSDGKLAYVYVPNTGGRGFTYFNRYYFAQQDKKGVVIDERNNGGGSAADYMIDIMNRDLFGYFNSKANDRRPWTTPIAGIWGPKVMIINERAGSGGDLLPYMFRAAEIGPLIGTRTWGGLVGTWDTPRFIDGGRMVAPRGGFFDVHGNWAVEGEGVAPDIEVIQTPKAVLAGKDPQLERAVEEALKLLETQEIQYQKEPAAPNRWKRARD